MRSETAGNEKTGPGARQIVTDQPIITTQPDFPFLNGSWQRTTCRIGIIQQTAPPSARRGYGSSMQ